MDSSPFAKPTGLGPEQSTLQKLFLRIGDKIDEFYVDSIPSDDVKAMPPRYMYPIGAVVLFVLVGIFAGVFIPSYLDQINAKFLVPSSESDSRYCDSVAISNTGSFLATQTGSWIGSSEFSYSEAAYVLDVTNLILDENGYINIMNSIYKSLVQIGNIAKTSDLGVNLLFWMTVTFMDDINAQRFNTVGNPLIIFNRQKTFGTISNVNGDCNATAYSFFDQANGLMTLEYSMSEFQSNPICQQTVDPYKFGYTPASNPTIFGVSVDIRTLITGLSVNLGVLYIGSLQEIVADRTTVSFTSPDGEVQRFNVSSYTNPTFPGMQPITCIFVNSLPRCVLQIGYTYALPVFNQEGANLTFPVVCNCSNLTEAELNDHYNPCNVFGFLSGFIFWNTTSQAPLFDITTRYSLTEINQLAFYPTYVSGAWGVSSPYYDSILNTPAYREDIYSFCNDSVYGPCSFVSFTSFDVSVTNWAVSSYFYSVPLGACRDTLTTSQENWNALIATPFAPLTQQYEECRNSPSSIFVQQAGVAAGNVSLLSPFGVLFVLVMVLLYERFSGTAIPKTFSKAEKDSALESLAIALLVARDEKMNPRRDKQKLAGIIAQIVDELSEQAESTVYKKEALPETVRINWSEMLRRGKKKSNHDSKKNGRSSAIELSAMESNNHNNSGSSSNAEEKQQQQRSLSVASSASSIGRPTASSNLIILNPVSASSDDNNSLRSVSRSGSTAGHASDHQHLAQLQKDASASDSKHPSDETPTLLYSETMGVLDEMVVNFQAAYAQSRGDVGNESNTNPLHSRSNSSNSSLWSLVAKTSLLRDLHVVTLLTERILISSEKNRDESDDDEESEEYSGQSRNNHTAHHSKGDRLSNRELNKMLGSVFAKIHSLALLHTSVTMGCALAGAGELYGEKVAYAVNGEAYTLNSLKRKAESCGATL